MSKQWLKVEIEQGPVGWNWIVWSRRDVGRWRRDDAGHEKTLREASLSANRSAEALELLAEAARLRRVRAQKRNGPL